MQLDIEEIKKIKKYFDDIEGKRISNWVTEMKRQVAIAMYSLGAKNYQIMKVLSVHNSTVAYYPRMVSDEKIKNIVENELMNWVDQGKYPIQLYRARNGESIHGCYTLVSASEAMSSGKVKYKLGIIKQSETNFKKMLDDVLE